MAGIIRASSRRDVLKISALAGIGTLVGGGPGQFGQVLAAPKKLTLMHESSFIPPYDAYVKNTLAPAYEKLTGIKVDYDVVSVGSLLTRVTTAAENASGPDLTAIGFNWSKPPSATFTMRFARGFSPRRSSCACISRGSRPTIRPVHSSTASCT